MAFIQHVLATYNDAADGAVKTAMPEFRCGRRTVRYQGVTESPLLDFPQIEWRNSSQRQAMIDDFIASGVHPFDALPTDPRVHAEMTTAIEANEPSDKAPPGSPPSESQ